MHLTRKESLVTLQTRLPQELTTLELALTYNLPSLACPDIMFNTLATTGKEVSKQHLSSHTFPFIRRWRPCPQKPGCQWPPSTSSRGWPPPHPFHPQHTHSPAIRYPEFGLAVLRLSYFAYPTIPPSTCLKGGVECKMNPSHIVFCEAPVEICQHSSRYTLGSVISTE